VITALSSIEKARQMDVSYMPVYRQWGQILQANGKYVDSIIPLLTYLNAVPNDPDAELLLATAYYHNGDIDKALSTIQKVISVNDKVIDAYLLRGDIYMTQNKLVEADNSYLRAQQLYYRSFGALIGRARVQLANTYAGAAYNYIETAMDAATTPREEAIALYWRAAALVGLKENSAAIRDYEAFFALPEGVAPPDLLEQARPEYLKLVTPTPSATATITNTPAPTNTITPTFTPSPSATVTLTSSPTPSPTK
jgi:tetratricopeptide (TPR) repeat protein